MTSALRVLALVSLFLAGAAGVSAQEQRDPSEQARFHWGAFHFTPGIVVTDVGFDNNVFNDPENQLSDTTTAVGPAVNLWINPGPLRITERSSGQYLYFKKYENQRSWNTANDVKIELPLSRLTPFAFGSYINTRQRPGFEIDSRARASVNVASLGVKVLLTGKTTVILSGTRTTTAFDEKETFLGSELATALDRHSDGELAQFRYGLTPLTTLVVNAEAVQDRFAHDRLRNADAISIRPGFEFKPFALIAGSVSVGFRHFNVLNEAVRDYQGLVAMVDARYLLTTSTQISATVNRDLAFSFDETVPYYALTISNVTIRQRVTPTWDVEARGGLQTLAYRGVRTEITDVPRTDRGRVFGLGVGYLIGETLRIGFDANYYIRRSPLTQRDYDGLRAGASVSYGILR